MRARQNRCIGSSGIVGFISPVNGSQEVIENKVRYFVARALADCEIGPKMDPGKNSAQSCLFCRSRILRERALSSRHVLGGDVEVEAILAEERNQNGCPASANDRMRSRVGWVRCGVADFRKPVRVRRRIGIVICSGGTYGGDWAAEILSVLCVVGSNHVVQTEGFAKYFLEFWT